MIVCFGKALFPTKNLMNPWVKGFQNLLNRNEDFNKNISTNVPPKIKKSIKIIKVFLNLLKRNLKNSIILENY